MSLIYNGTTISKLVYNSTEVKKMTYNGTSVFTAGVDPSKTSYTEAEFIEVINAGLQGTMIVGTTVALTNSYCSSYNVIGVNHDGTTNTVDLYGNSIATRSNYGTTNMWVNSTMRTWLNETFINGFTNVSNLLKTMTVTTNRSTTSSYTTSDKAKLLSGTEIGATECGEGTKYEAFSSHPENTDYSDIYRKESYSEKNWFRTLYNNYNSGYALCVMANGSLANMFITSDKWTTSLGIVPVIRF